MSKGTLFDKVWDLHTVRHLETGQDQILIGRHLIHEVTSPQAFTMVDERNLLVLYPHTTFATVDHIVPTLNRTRPLQDLIAEVMLKHLEHNTKKHGIKLFNLGDENQGVVHIIGPELGITQPGMTIVCGDSHTSTHGAFGAIALGIGTTQIACVLATGCLLLQRPKVRKIQIDGILGKNVTAKDIILTIINRLGVNGGIGYAYEYAGSVIRELGMEERMTICNMSIEGGAQCGYVNPDDITVEYLRGRQYVPQGEEFNEAVNHWLSLVSDPRAEYDDIFVLPAEEIEPMMTYGITPGQSIGVSQNIPTDAPRDALDYMKLEAGKPLLGQKVDVAFIGSCTNGRMSDLVAAAALISNYRLKVASGVTAIVVPGSESVRRNAEQYGLDRVFIDAGWEWRESGCSMCLAMNPDKLQGDQLCASSSNRNFKGRQGSSRGRTILMSPESVVACASRGVIADVRDVNKN